MKILIIILSLSLSVVALLRWFAPRVESYADTLPVFNIRDFFNGEIRASGMVLNWRGQVRRRFTATMHGSWQGTRGTLKEEYLFDDGEVQQRTWALELRSQNRFSGHAADVVGIADGQQYGSAVRIDYVLRIPVNGRNHDIRIDDWLYLQPDGTVLNESRMSLFGLPVGRLITMMRRI